MEKMQQKAKCTALLWKLVLFGGTVPFLVPLFLAIVRAITGYPMGLIVSTGSIYGWEAFYTVIFMYSYLLWPTYLVGLALIILGICKIKKP